MSNLIAMTRVRHGERLWEVSTINRQSSAALAPDHWYTETLVFELDAVGKRGNIVWQGDGYLGGIGVHLAVVARLHFTGSADEGQGVEG